MEKEVDGVGDELYVSKDGARRVLGTIVKITPPYWIIKLAANGFRAAFMRTGTKEGKSYEYKPVAWRKK